MAGQADADVEFDMHQQEQELPEDEHVRVRRQRRSPASATRDTARNISRAIAGAAHELYVSPESAARMAAETVAAGRAAIRAQFASLIPNIIGDEDADGSSSPGSDTSFDRHFAAQLDALNLR